MAVERFRRPKVSHKTALKPDARQKPFVYTATLFARPSFCEGAARIFDFANAMSMYNYSRTPEDADIRAIRSDWEAIGMDMWGAVSQEAEGQKRSA